MSELTFEKAAMIASYITPDSELRRAIADLDRTRATWRYRLFASPGRRTFDRLLIARLTERLKAVGLDIAPAAGGEATGGERGGESRNQKDD